jgi:heat shock protein HslJ
LRHALHPFALVLAALATACGSSADGVTTTDTPSESASPIVPPTLIGPTWRLVSMDGREALPGVRVTALFGADERVSGSAGCNRYTGRAVATAAQLETGLLAMTRMHCGAGGVMEQEQAYVAALEKAKAYRILGGELQLGPAPGVVSLAFRLE